MLRQIRAGDPNVELNTHINDESFARVAADTLLESLAPQRKPGRRGLVNSTAA